jgi:hypothetical protein
LLSKSTLADDRAAIARATRSMRRHPDDPALHDQLIRARRAYAEAKLTEQIQQVLANAPPLTMEQRSRIAALLTGSEGAGNAA